MRVWDAFFSLKASLVASLAKDICSLPGVLFTSLCLLRLADAECALIPAKLFHEVFQEPPKGPLGSK